MIQTVCQDFRSGAATHGPRDDEKFLEAICQSQRFIYEAVYFIKPSDGLMRPFDPPIVNRKISVGERVRLFPCGSTVWRSWEAILCWCRKIKKRLRA